MPRKFTPRRATCGDCGGGRKKYRWAKDSKGEWYVEEYRCPTCGGSGVR